MTRDNGDEVAAMVLALVTELVKEHKTWRSRQAEPTGIFVPEDVRDVICRGSSTSKARRAS